MNLPDEVFARIDVLLERQGEVMIAIDGGSGTGKTTAAALIAERYGCSVVHMDDFFLPPELRTPERYAEPGGNVHYERFEQEVIAPLARGEDFSYRIFDCSLCDYCGERDIRRGRVLIVEGAYCNHPRFGDIYDLRLFFTLPRDEQLSRIRARGGEAAEQMFLERWIPLEELYFAAFGIRERCDIVIENL